MKLNVNVQGSIAADVWPNGAILNCTRCHYCQRATVLDCAEYLRSGWPTHCGRTMTVEQPASPRPSSPEGV